ARQLEESAQRAQREPDLQRLHTDPAACQATSDDSRLSEIDHPMLNLGVQARCRHHELLEHRLGATLVQPGNDVDYLHSDERIRCSLASRAITSSISPSQSAMTDSCANLPRTKAAARSPSAVRSA